MTSTPGARPFLLIGTSRVRVLGLEFEVLVRGAVFLGFGVYEIGKGECRWLGFEERGMQVARLGIGTRDCRWLGFRVFFRDVRPTHRTVLIM